MVLQGSRTELIKLLCNTPERKKLEKFLLSLTKGYASDVTLLLSKFFPAEEVAQKTAELTGRKFWSEEQIKRFVEIKPEIVKYGEIRGTVVKIGDTFFTHALEAEQISPHLGAFGVFNLSEVNLNQISVVSFEKLAGIMKADSEKEVWEKITQINTLPEDQRAGKLLKYLLEQAIYRGASDVHLEYTGVETGGIVRFRIGGTLEVFGYIPPSSHTLLINYLRTTINENSSPKDTVKDGAFRWKIHTDEIDVRVNVSPAMPRELGEFTYERAVLRILRKNSSLSYSLENLGLSEFEKDTLEASIRTSYGMVITSGPTSSGKTTTLYALLSRIDALSKKVITVEDPVEFMNPYLWHQHQVEVSQGYTFEEALKGVLREDPDVCLVGEVRDKNSAKALVHLANTGHLTFTTLHANNSFDVIRRLKDFGVEEKDVRDFGVLFMAQRLMRTSCPYCQVERPVREVEQKLLGVEVDTVIDNEGCERCEYRGTTRERVLVLEMLPLIYEDVQEKVFVEKMRYREIFEYLKERYGIKRMAEKALDLNRQKRVSITEIIDKLR